MNEVKIFNSPQFGEVRTAGDADNPIFCLTDVCKSLDLSAKEVNRRLSKEVVSKQPLETAGGTQNALFVNEDGLYDVILDSRKPKAKAFRKWITCEVLPSIRKSGGYIAAQPDESPEMIMAKALKVADEAIKRREQQLQMAQSTIEEQESEIKSLTPLADYTKAVLQSTSTFTLTQVSKDLGFCSVHKFCDWAQKKGILYKQSRQWMPHSKYSGLGYFSIRTAKYVKQDNTIGTSKSTVIAEKGIAYLHSLIDKEAKKGGAL